MGHRHAARDLARQHAARVDLEHERELHVLLERVRASSFECSLDGAAFAACTRRRSTAASRSSRTPSRCARRTAAQPARSSAGHLHVERRRRHGAEHADHERPARFGHLHASSAGTTTRRSRRSASSAASTTARGRPARARRRTRTRAPARTPSRCARWIRPATSTARPRPTPGTSRTRSRRTRRSPNQPTNPTTNTSASFAFAGTDNFTRGRRAHLPVPPRQHGAGRLGGLHEPEGSTTASAAARTPSRCARSTRPGTRTRRPRPTRGRCRSPTRPRPTRSSTEAAATTTDTNASFTFSATESTSTYECKLDTGALGGLHRPEDVHEPRLGPHTFQVRAKDAANNQDGSPASYTWTIQAPAPPAELRLAGHPHRQRRRLDRPGQPEHEQGRRLGPQGHVEERRQPAGARAVPDAGHARRLPGRHRDAASVRGLGQGRPHDPGAPGRRRLERGLA